MSLNSKIRCASASAVVLSLAVMGCGGATNASKSPHGTATTTAARIAPRVERLVVAEQGTISMVARDGCVAMVQTTMTQVAGSHDELRVRCPKDERMKSWFEGADRIMAGFAFEAINEDEEDAPALPAAKVLTESGKTMKLTRNDDIKKLAGEVRALSAELASAEQPSPGPASPAGWQMIRVTGPAHVLFAGTPARGVFEAKVSTSGQYMCEFVTNVGGEGPLRATKSGFLKPATAAKAIDEVLGPFAAIGPNEKSKQTYVAATKSGAESRSNAASTSAVFARFAQVQEALGDACLPELEAPPPQSIGL